MKTSVILRTLGLLAVIGFGLETHASATTVGLTPNTSGSYGLWDTFPSAGFTGRAPDAGAAISNQLLSLTSGGFLTGAGDRIYLNGQPSSWTATGTTSFAIKSFTLQLKNYQFTSQSLTSFFTASLTIGGNTFTPDSVVAAPVAEGANTDEIVTWTWSAGLAANTGSNFSVNFANANGANISIDGFDLGANPNAIPEPPTTVLFTVAAAGGLLALGAARRGRRGEQA